MNVLLSGIISAKKADNLYQKQRLTTCTYYDTQSRGWKYVDMGMNGESNTGKTRQSEEKS